MITFCFNNYLLIKGKNSAFGIKKKSIAYLGIVLWINSPEFLQNNWSNGAYHFTCIRSVMEPGLSELAYIIRHPLKFYNQLSGKTIFQQVESHFSIESLINTVKGLNFYLMIINNFITTKPCGIFLLCSFFVP